MSRLDFGGGWLDGVCRARVIFSKSESKKHKWIQMFTTANDQSEQAEKVLIFSGDYDTRTMLFLAHII